jgi:hemerythrin-like metal-binding protein
MNNLLFIVWNKQNEVGIELIDEQHRGIVSIINTLYYMMREKANHQLLYPSISDTMRAYSKMHFITEEHFLERIAYKDIQNHKKIHEKLIFTIDKIERECARDNDIMPLLEFLKHWWIGHINTEDKKYAQALQDYLRSM